MRKLNYAYKLGDTVIIPKGISWQVNEVAGEYIIAGVLPDNRILLTNESNRIQIGTDHLAYLMGESEPVEIGKIYWGAEYQPEWEDDGHLCVEQWGNDMDEDPPFWYCGRLGNGDRVIYDDLVRGKWCAIKLPWET
jgi:hypothetical protein